MLDAMYTGRSRRSSASSLEGRTLNYLNNSVGTIMFLNQRSATMQLTSAFNYINWHDNNPIKAGAAVANIPQYAKDIKTLFTSDWAKSRRQGLRINVTESEIADAVTGSENTPKSIVSLLLKKGFAPTQIADAVATAVGGASLYRNRIKRYVKEGMDSVEAEKQAMQDWVEISETNQQSSRPDKVSMQQRSDLGKLVLAFANTPMQYMRESKKAILDLKNGRGDKKTHLSKIAYYSIIQSAAFSAMQQAMFKMAWSDDEQDELWLKNKGPKVLNSMADGALRGMGYGGAIVSMIKNTGLELAKQNEYGYKGKLENAAWKLLDVSPPVSSKISKIRYSFKNIDRAGGFEKAKKLPLSLDNPFIKSAAGVTEAVANVPTARLLSKITNLSELANAESQWYEKMMIMAGWKKWEIEAERDFDKKKSKKKKKKTYGTGSIKTKSY
jgi:RNase P protein component